MRCCLLFMSAGPPCTPARALLLLGRPILQTSNPTHDHATPINKFVSDGRPAEHQTVLVSHRSLVRD